MMIKNNKYCTAVSSYRSPFYHGMLGFAVHSQSTGIVFKRVYFTRERFKLMQLNYFKGFNFSTSEVMLNNDDRNPLNLPDGEYGLLHHVEVKDKKKK